MDQRPFGKYGNFSNSSAPRGAVVRKLLGLSIDANVRFIYGIFTYDSMKKFPCD